MTADLSLLRKGDIIKGVRTMEVTSAGNIYTYLRDVQDRQVFVIRTDGSENGSWYYEMVKRVPREVKAGDVLTGAEVKAHQWKRGSHLVGELAQHHFVLTSEGDWFSPAPDDDETEAFLAFRELPDDARYRVIHVG